MSYVKTKDGVDIFYKDWGPKDAQPIHFHHGWPLSADDWDNPLLAIKPVDAVPARRFAIAPEQDEQPPIAE